MLQPLAAALARALAGPRGPERPSAPRPGPASRPSRPSRLEGPRRGRARPAAVASVAAAAAPPAQRHHVVAKGDTIFSVAKAHGLTVRELQALNHLQTDRLLLGAKLQVSGAPRYDKWLREFGHGWRRTTRRLAERGPKEHNIGKAGKRAQPAPPAPRRRRSQRHAEFRKPRKRFVSPVAVAEGYISSPFGLRLLEGVLRRHAGVDIAADTGTVIRAAGKGVVKFSGESGGNYGLLIVIQHAEGFSTRYAHCHAVRCQAGRRVQAGDVIGEVGATGRATGPHLHFELRRDGVAIDPFLHCDL